MFTQGNRLFIDIFRIQGEFHLTFTPLSVKLHINFIVELVELFELVYGS